MSTKPITFQAYFYKATTTVDGGWRIYLDLTQYAGDVVATLAKTQGVMLQVAVMPDEEESNEAL